MQKARLLSTVAAVLLLTAGAASAQGKKDEAPAPAPAAQQKAPAEKVAPNMNAGDKKAESTRLPETTGQAPSAADAGKTRATDKAATDKEAVEKSAPKATAAPASTDSKTSVDTKASGDTKSATPAAAPKSSTTTGQGAAAGAAKLSTEQRTKITSVIKQQKVAPVKLDVSINVGTRIPASVHFYPLPQEVYVIYPEWRGYDYILVGDEIIVINPRTREIVAILDA